MHTMKKTTSVERPRTVKNIFSLWITRHGLNIILRLIFCALHAHLKSRFDIILTRSVAWSRDYYCYYYSSSVSLSRLRYKEKQSQILACIFLQPVRSFFSLSHVDEFFISFTQKKWACSVTFFTLIFKFCTSTTYIPIHCNQT